MVEWIAFSLLSWLLGDPARRRYGPLSFREVRAQARPGFAAAAGSLLVHGALTVALIWLGGRIGGSASADWIRDNYRVERVSLRQGTPLYLPAASLPLESQPVDAASAVAATGPRRPSRPASPARPVTAAVLSTPTTTAPPAAVASSPPARIHVEMPVVEMPVVEIPAAEPTLAKLTEAQLALDLHSPPPAAELSEPPLVEKGPPGPPDAPLPILRRFQETLLRVYSMLLAPMTWAFRYLPSQDRPLHANWTPPAAGLPQLVRTVHPANGRFDITVVQSSAADSLDAPTDALSGQPVYLVHLPVGTRRQWILQYCLPGAAVARQSDGVVTLSAPQSVRAPYPIVSLRPEVRSHLSYVLVHGYVDTAGRTGGLRLLRATDPVSSAALLAALAQWQFRPATLDGRPIRVEVLFAIPPDRA